MTVTLALDGMGGDAAPEIVVAGAARALEQRPNLRFLLFGDAAKIEHLLQDHPELAAATELRHTPDAVAADAKPSSALRQGRNSSMRLAIDAVRDGDAGAAVSAGNTGALMAMAVFALRTLPGIDRPAISSVMPSLRGPVVFLDLGANVECAAQHLFQFAVMGEVYARTVLGIRKPRVGLLNVGTEELKGDGVVRRAAGLLRDSDLEIDYAGFVEGTDVTKGSVDVVVTDGFTGNVALKMAEGTASLFTTALKDAFASSWRGKLGYLLARPALRSLRDRFDPRLYNGALFLGVNGVVVKSHGGTDAIGFAAAINAAVEFISQGTNQRIIEEMGLVTEQPEPKPKAAAG